MSKVSFSGRAFGKIMMHAAKYPHCSINGLLLGTEHSLRVLDVVPLFHQCLHLAPMAEVALTQVDALAQSSGLTIIGYYAASEHFKDNTIEKAPGTKIVEKIAEFYPSALFAVIDNRRFSMEPDATSLKVFQHHDGKWRNKDDVLIDSSTLDCVSRLLKTAAYKSLIDFDNHLDDVSLDWANNELNKEIDQLISMDG